MSIKNRLSHTHVGKAAEDKNPGIKPALTSSRVTKAGFERLDYSVIRLDSDNRVIVRLSIVRQRNGPLKDLGSKYRERFVCASEM